MLKILIESKYISGKLRKFAPPFFVFKKADPMNHPPRFSCFLTSCALQNIKYRNI